MLNWYFFLQQILSCDIFTMRLEKKSDIINVSMNYCGKDVNFYWEERNIVRKYLQKSNQKVKEGLEGLNLIRHLLMIWASIMTCTCCEHEIKFHSFIHSFIQWSWKFALFTYKLSIQGSIQNPKMCQKSPAKTRSFLQK